MEAKRITASPRRPSNGLRVFANKRSAWNGNGDGFYNCVKMLQRREIGSKLDRCFSMSDYQERFTNIFLQEEYDTKDPNRQPALLPFLYMQTQVIEIVSARGVIFALLQSGDCAAFSRETNQRICFLNVSHDEVIRSLYYNKYNESVITVSVFASDIFRSLKCRTTRIEYIQRCQPDAGFLLFESESLKWPDFIEFDDVNAKILTFSALDSIYKVFDMRNYTMLYSIYDKNVQEIKISPGMLLLIYTKASSHIPLKILSIEDGSVLKSVNHLLHPNEKVDFIEQFKEKLLVKLKNKNLQIIDVRTSELIEVTTTELIPPTGFIFLYENQLFLTISKGTVDVWNFRGEQVTSFEDQIPLDLDRNNRSICITRNQDLIISHCMGDSNVRWGIQNGSINIRNISTGKSLAKIKAGNTGLLRECECSGERCHLSKTKITSTVEQALNYVTALFYDKERNEIYSGTGLGLIHVWAK